MKRFLSIFLLGVYLLTATESHQLIRFVFLFEHFQEHKTLSKDLSLWEFMEHHYAKTNANDGHNAKDNKLPFKSSEVCLANSLIAVVGSSELFYSFEPFLIDTFLFQIDQEQFLSSTQLSSIWQPPKFC